MSHEGLAVRTMNRKESPFRTPFQRDTECSRSNPPVHRHHLHDLEAALAASIGRNFDFLSRQFREVQSESSTEAQGQ